jgi:rhodanese-related sulfurtransferase
VNRDCNHAVEEIGVREAWQRLADDPKTLLVDVRTRAEWAFVGLPDLSPLGKQPILIEWQTFPDNRVAPDFVDRLVEQLRQKGADQSTPLLFLCRSGGRSMMAARALAAIGYAACANVVEGFEGPLDSDRHRGSVAGWKAEGLPWLQG